MLTIYKASAGSGKTFNLAFRYIRQLLGRKSPDGKWHLVAPTSRHARPHSHILAITFTNKATAEMKRRIIKELDLLADMPAPGERDSQYASMLTADYSCSRQDLATAAAAALRLLLNDYSAFNISTIDSFFQTILRSFAREIDRQGDYRLELDSNFAVTSAVTMLFDDVNYHEKGVSDSVGQWLRDDALRRLDQGEEFNPFNRTGSTFKNLTSYFNKTFNETFTKHAEELHAFLTRPGATDRFRDAIDRRIASLLSESHDMANQLREALEAEGLSDDNLNSSIASLVSRSLADTIFDNNVATAMLKKRNDRAKYLLALEYRDESYFGRGGFFKAKIKASDEAHLALFEWFDVVRNAVVQWVIYSEIARSITTLKALGFINDYINRFRQDNNLILINDTNSLLRSIINGADAPFIYERVGLELRHFLIDEFQDTSRLQWENLQPLVANSLSAGDDSLIIGDVKQSIYRWRGGDSSLLDHRVQTDPDLADNEVLGTTIDKNTNWRSSHGVVRFNNTIFCRMADETQITGYDGATQALPAATADLPWYINIRRLDSKDEDILRERVASFLGDDVDLLDACYQDGVFDNKRAAAIVCGHRIMQQHAAGYQWKDIAVLCRRVADGALVTSIFNEYFPEIKIMSSETLLLENSPAVKLIISMLEIIDYSYAGLQADIEPTDNHTHPDMADAMMNRFEYYVAKGDDIDVALDKALRGNTDAADQSAPDATGATSLIGDIAELRRMAPANLLSMVEAIISLKVPEAQRMAELPYINAFLDAVSEFSDNHIPTVHAFLEYWGTVCHSLAITAPSGLDAVDIMTVHKAKGLEWRCVHIPFMYWELTARSEPAWFDLSVLTDIDPADRPPILYLNPTQAFIEPNSPFREAINRQIQADSADNMNVAYVAFTRAINELDITLTDAFSDGDGSLSDALFQALHSRNLPSLVADIDASLFVDTADCFDEAGNFSFGSPTTPPAKSEQPTAKKKRPLLDPKPIAPRQPAFNFNSTASRIARVDDLINEPAGGLDVDQGLPLPMQPITDADADSAARARGTNLHAILALMQTSDDLDRAVDRVVYDLHAEPTLAEEYRSVLVRAFKAAGDYADCWFGPDTRRVLAEQTIYDTERGENWRPDRIVWTADGHIDIIDYKFTASPSKHHADQVRGYMNMLRSMGHDNLRGFVWYPDLQRIIAVDN